jgi:hypothetical protein
VGIERARCQRTNSDGLLRVVAAEHGSVGFATTDADSLSPHILPDVIQLRQTLRERQNLGLNPKIWSRGVYQSRVRVDSHVRQYSGTELPGNPGISVPRVSQIVRR